MDSILTSIKAYVGISEDDESFDPEIIDITNSAFADLNDMGVGPDEIFSIEDKSSTWDDFTEDNKSLARVMPYMKHKVKLDFDPPANSVLIDVANRRMQELEWRLTNMSKKDGES